MLKADHNRSVHLPKLLASKIHQNRFILFKFAYALRRYRKTLRALEIGPTEPRFQICQDIYV